MEITKARQLTTKNHTVKYQINTTKIQICEHKILQTQKENCPTLLRLLSHIYTTAVLCHINLYKTTNFIVSLGYSFLTLLPTCTVGRSKAHWFTFVGFRWVSEMLTSNMEKKCETYYIFIYMYIICVCIFQSSEHICESNFKSVLSIQTLTFWFKVEFFKIYLHIVRVLAFRHEIS